MLLNAFRSLFSNSPNRKARRSCPPQLLQLEGRIVPANFQVTSLADTVASDSVITLREAITLANTTAGNDTIDFASSLLSGGVVVTYLTLTAQLPQILSATQLISGGGRGTVTITGPGASSFCISGANGDFGRNFGIFDIAIGGNLSISGVAVVGVQITGSGGAFNNSGILTVSNSMLSGNFANNVSGNTANGGAIRNTSGGIVTVSNSQISGNIADGLGGGISNSGTLTITNSRISGNSVASFSAGGGIHNDDGGTLTITNSRISENSAGNDGGGIWSSGQITIANSTISGNTAHNGGGILNNGPGSNLTISNSTLSGNSAPIGVGGGIRNNYGGTLSVTSSTISGNTAVIGGGISNSGTLNIANTIIANSTNGASTPAPTDDYAGVGTVNRISPSSAANNIVTLDTNTNTSTNTSAWATTVSVLNLGLLQDNGGPTFTIALTNLSPSSVKTGGNAAISNSSPIFGLDQRGINRSSTAPSIGAFENYALPTVTSIFPTTGSTVGGTSINITGTGFAGATAVTIGGVAVSSFTVVNSTSITATTPAGIVGTANVEVTTPAGINAANTLFTYTAAVAPTVTSISPATGAAKGGTPITITGTDFTGATAVTIGGAAAANVIVVSETSITATTPAGSVGTASVEVTTPIGTNATNTLFTYTVATITTTTALASTTPSVFGQSVTFTATVAAVSPGAGTATGTVQFSDGGVSLGNAVTLTSGSATSAAITSFGVGTHNITAAYSGSSSFITSTSSAVSQVVSKANTTTALASSVNPSLFQQSVTFTATVAATAPGAGTATGTVQFFDNGSAIGSAITLISGSATSAAITNFGGGTHIITAVYSGDASFFTSTSSAVSQVVTLLPRTTTALTSSVNPSLFGQSITFTATVAAVLPAAGNATGYVLFFDNGIGLTFAILSAGTATTAAISNFGVGTHNITAVYSGDASFVTSTSSAVSQVVLGTANTPTFGTPTSTADGFTVQISNYDGAFTYGGTATAGGAIGISNTGLVTVSGLAANTSSTATITTTRANYVSGSAQVTATSNVAPTPPTPNPTPNPTPTPTPTPTAPLVVATPPPPSSSGSSTVNLYNAATGEPTGTAVPFPGFDGPVKVASGDFNNDGVAELVAGAGFGGGPAIAILDSQTGKVMESFFAFDPAFTGGVFVAVQDTNNDGILDIIASAGPGGGPEVRIFDGATLNVLRSFFAYDQSFTGGVSVATIDFNNDGILDLVTGAGPGGAPHVKVFDGATNAIISQWYAYPASFTGGVFVAAGDIGNDGNIEVVTGAGPGGAPIVAVWDPYTGALLAQFMAYSESFTGGVRVGINDGNSDGIADIITGAGPGGGPQVNVFSFPALDLLFSFYSGDPTNTGGVFVS